MRRANSLARGTLEQVSGHSDTFMRISLTQIWKLTDTPERNMLQLLMCTPALCSLVPRYSQDIPLSHWEGREPQEDSVCVELQDLTAGFGDSPCVMDIKVGIRTFLEDEVSNPKLRPDLLKKMDKLDPSAATAEEREHGGITKLRYMQFREQMSTSSNLGFRLEGLKVSLPGGERLEEGIPAKEALSRIRTDEGVMAHLRTFIQRDPHLKSKYLQRLRFVFETLWDSDVFHSHQFINTSLLFVHDASTKEAGVWMIDFSKARPSSRKLTHTEPWQLGNQEDGYLHGLKNLIRIFEHV